VGAKKAKSIARRNQQRAYNEFVREQGEAQRAEWAQEEEKRKEEFKAERERRAAVDTKVKEKERQEREARKAREEAARLGEQEAASSAIQLVEERLAQKGIISIREVAGTVERDIEWVQQLVRREGMLGIRIEDDVKQVVMLTKSGWLARICSRAMGHAYQEAVASCSRSEGRIIWDEFGRLVQSASLNG
jgi:chemotaxis protein histidine kinase CheA